MNILLVYPEYPATFWSFKYSLKFISKNRWRRQAGETTTKQEKEIQEPQEKISAKAPSGCRW